MAIIIDLKNAIRKTIFEKDSSINFYFNTILKAKFPFVFFYIPSFKLDKALHPEYWRKLTVMCVIEYAKEEDNSATQLWEYADILADTYKLFDFADTKLSVTEPEFKIVEGVLQMTFDLEFYVRLEDKTELMRELDLTINKGDLTNGSNTTKI